MLHRKRVGGVLLVLIFWAQVQLMGQGQTFTAREDISFNIQLVSFPEQYSYSRDGQAVKISKSSRIEVFPGGDPADVIFNWGQSSHIEIMDRGELMVYTKEKTTTQAKPIAYQIDSYGIKKFIPAEFIRKGNQISIVTGPYEGASVLFIELSSSEVVMQQGI